MTKYLNISFIIPAYNCEETIVKSVTSIVYNNLSDGDEIVIVNDGSTDNTSKIINNLSHQYSNIKVMHHKRNRGGAATRNTAVENSKHDIVFCLDSDNLLEAGSICKLKNILENTGADVASFQELHFFNESTSKIDHKWIFKQGKITLADSLSGKIVPIASGNYLFTKDSWYRAGGYPEFAGALDAWGFGFRQLATGAKMVVLPDSYYYHRHGHESYWRRDVKYGNTSLKALQIILPYIDLIADDDVNFIMGPEGRNTWFELLGTRPFMLKSGELGSVGYIENISAKERTPKTLTGIAARINYFCSAFLHKVLGKNKEQT